MSDTNYLKTKVKKWTSSSIRAYDNANNGKLSEFTREHFDALEKGYGVMIENICAEYDVKVDWPGLSPRFNWKGHDYHCIDSLVIALDKVSV